MFLVVGCGLLPVAAPTAVAAQPAEQALAAAVEGFLTTWIVKRDPALAVQQFVSRTLDDERFVPAPWYSAAEYHRKFDGEGKRTTQKIPNEEFARRMREYLTQLLPADVPVRAATVQQVLQPFSLDVVRANPGLSKLMQHEPRQLDKLPAIAYRASDWPDVSWTSSGTVGLRTALAQRAAGRHLRAVVVRPSLDGAQSNAPLLFMLWADEGGKDGWKLWTLEPVPLE